MSQHRVLIVSCLILSVGFVFFFSMLLRTKVRVRVEDALTHDVVVTAQLEYFDRVSKKRRVIGAVTEDGVIRFRIPLRLQTLYVVAPLYKEMEFTRAELKAANGFLDVPLEKVE